MKEKLIALLIVGIIAFFVCGFCWEYSIEEIASMTGRDVDVKLWQAGLFSLVPFLGQASIPIAVVVWVVSLFI